jgi:hypothetical protein
MREKLQQFIERAEGLRGQNADTPEFNVWNNDVIRFLKKEYGSTSDEFRSFKKIHFFNVQMAILSGEYQNDKEFRNGIQEAILTLKSYQDDIYEEGKLPADNETTATYRKIFISHSEEDKPIVGELIDLFEGIGLKPEQIFCSSFEGYGIPLGEDFLDVIKKEISKDVLVLFILSKNFYKSSICLCEMGAFWVLAKVCIPMIIPPFTFDDIKGVLPKTIQGLPVNDKLKINSLQEKLLAMFNLAEQPMSAWERKRDRVIERINTKINESTKKSG